MTPAASAVPWTRALASSESTAADAPTWNTPPRASDDARATFAQEWAKKNNRPVFLGEFGAYEKADMTSRAKWTAAVVKEAESRGFSWAYWEFASGFGAYDRDKKAWRDPLLHGLIPPAK